MAEAIAQTHGLPLVVSRLLVSRGVAFDDVAHFINPTLKMMLPDPSVMKDMDKAALRLARAIVNKDSVAIFGDYDVDGATSSALFKRYFDALGLPLRVYIPDRIAEGYGPNAPALRKLRDEGVTLVVTVDCGTAAFDALEEGAKAGLDVVVVDHHRAEARLPQAVAIVNPNRLDDESGLGQLAAVGVSFMIIVAVNRLLRQQGWFTPNTPEPRVLQWLDIVALGTICDVVPLTGLNRAFAAQGLRVMAMRQNAGLNALADIAGASGPADAFQAGFVFGPRVNAGGRVGECDLGWRLLSTQDAIEARVLAGKLHQYNAERKLIEADVIEDALVQVEEKGLKDDCVLLVDGDGWHAGVIGIVAARLKEKYNRPACVIAFDDAGLGKASGRSVAGIDLGAAVVSAKDAGLLLAGGGHKMAAGFTVARENLKALHAHMCAHVTAQLNGASAAPELRVDGVLSGAGLTLELVEKLSLLAPYGAGHAEPRFAVAGVKIIRPTVVGEKHVSCFIQDTAGGTSVKAIAFRALDSALGEALLKSAGKTFNLAGHVTINQWQGKKNVNFQIVDASIA